MQCFWDSFCSPFFLDAHTHKTSVQIWKVNTHTCVCLGFFSFKRRAVTSKSFSSFNCRSFLKQFYKTGARFWQLHPEQNNEKGKPEENQSSNEGASGILNLAFWNALKRKPKFFGTSPPATPKLWWSEKGSVTKIRNGLTLAGRLHYRTHRMAKTTVITPIFQQIL